MKPNLNIITTATPRNDLHEKGLFPTLKAICDFGFWNVRWYVNLDCIPFIEEEEVTKTTKAFKRIAKENGIDLSLHVERENIGFNQAGKRSWIRSQETMCEGKHIYFWLEDDWYFADGTGRWETFDKILKRFLRDDYFRLCNMTTPNKCSGGPSLYKQDFVDELIHLYNTKECGDPEVMMQRTALRLWFDNYHIIWTFRPTLFTIPHRRARYEEYVSMWDRIIKAVPRFMLSGEEIEKLPYQKSVAMRYGSQHIFKDLGRNWRHNKKLGSVQKSDVGQRVYKSVKYENQTDWTQDLKEHEDGWVKDIAKRITKIIEGRSGE